MHSEELIRTVDAMLAALPAEYIEPRSLEAMARDLDAGMDPEGVDSRLRQGVASELRRRAMALTN